MTSKLIEANRFIHDGFLDTFGREFCKHDVLWKPKPNCKEFEIQSATHVAYRTMAQALNLPVEDVLKLLATFPAACLDLISSYELRRKIDAGCRMPDWLTLLAGQSRFLKNYTKFCLVRKLCESARVGLGAGATGGPAGVTDNEPPPLRGPRAIAYFVSRHGVREEDVLPAWRNVLDLCVVKQRAVLETGDRIARLSAILRPSAAERALADLALLHDALVAQMTLLTPAKLRTLVLLFQLIVAAKETYDGGGTDAGGGAPGGRHGRYEVNGDDNNLSRLDNIGGKETCAPTSGDSDEAPETADSSTITAATLSRLDSAIEELSVECMKPRSARNLLRESVVERAPRRRSDDDEYAPEEESSDEELHKELDLKPEIYVISSDSSDCEISDTYFEECSKDNIEVPVSLDEGRIEESGSDIMEKNNLSYRERESYISAKSQNSDTKSEYPTKYWYEESESNSSEERMAVWALVYTDFKKRGRSASLISLQHRWVELLHLARAALLTAWNSDPLVDRNVHPLLLVVAHWCPEIVTENLPSWKSLVLERKIVLESDIKHIIHKYRENDNVLLNVTENISFSELLKKYVTNKTTIDPHGHTKSNATNKHLTYQIHKENTSSIINNTSKVLEQDSQAQDNEINNESNVNNCISTMLDQIDPSKAKISIIIDEDSDEDAEEGNRSNYDNSVSHETTYLNNIDVTKSERSATNLREENNHIPMTIEKVNELAETTMKNIEKEFEDKLNYINNTGEPRNEFVENNCPDFNENINDENELLTDKQTLSHDFESQEESSSLHKSVIDEKLLNPARIVITPIEHLPEWKKHSTNGVINCRKFSVKNFMKPVTATSIQLSKCATNVNNNKNNNEECGRENYMNNEVRIKFEDDTFETDFDFDDDINNGIKYQKYIELYNMPDHLRKNRMKLTRTLKLSRTYFSSNFWSLDSNIELMKLCKPMAIKLSKIIPRVTKRVELSDINEVRRVNRSILTAQVLPTVGTPAPHAQRPSTSQEAVTTNNSMSSNSDTTRQTNCLSKDLDSTELLNLLTNYVIQTNISKESVIESVRKEITLNSNLMDSIIDTMRLADKNNSQHSSVICGLNSLQQNSLPSSNTSEMLLESNISKNISATHTLNTIQKSTEEVRNNLKFNSTNNSLLDATTSTIHLSSNCTKELYIKHLQVNNIKNSSLNLIETVIPNVGDLNDMILDLVKRFDTKMRREYSMKVNRRSLNLVLKNFERQVRGFAKNISKLTKILPQYFFNIKPKRRVTKNATEQNKLKKVNRIKFKESKDHSTIPSSNTENSNDIANTNTVFADDDCEPILVIDERSLELSDNICLNNLQRYEINTNKDIQETCNIKKNDMKEKHIKKAKKRSRQSNKILEKEEPMLDEYQEWHRQKTMALKYFTIPMSDSSKQASKVKITQQQITMTTTERQSYGSQTTIPIIRKNTEDIETTSTEQRSNGSQTTIPIIRKNTEGIATTSTEQQSNGSQTTIPIIRKNTEDIATTSTEQQSNGSQTTIPIKRKNTEDIATTSTEQQSYSSQTTIPIKRKNTEDIATTSTEQQSYGSQTTIPIKRKSTVDIATTSTASDITKRPKFDPNDVVYISDSSSDYDEQISKCYTAQDTGDNNPNSIRPDIHQINLMNTTNTENANKVLIFNDTLPKQPVNQNVCVINAPVAVSTQPIYIIITDTQLPTATQDAINKTQDSETINNPPVFQVLSNATSFLTPTQIVSQSKTQQNQIVVMNEKCTLTNKCKCIKCGNTLRDDILNCTLDLIQNPEDSRNNQPSTSLQQENNHLNKETITVKEYLSANKKLTTLIKVDASQKLLFFCSKYIILTDVNIPSSNATYRVSIKIKNKQKLSRVLVPSDIKGSVLLLGLKNETDYIYCKCLKGKSVKCNLCQRMKDDLPNPTNLLKIDNVYYKIISQNPNKCVRLTENELKVNSRAVLEGAPDLILINKMFFKKLSDSPPTYVRILSAPQNAATIRHLVRKNMLLYAFDVTRSRNCFTPLVYTRTSGLVTVDHFDNNLVKVLQWIFN